MATQIDKRDTRQFILREIETERIKQDVKWGEQNIPSVKPGIPAHKMFDEYGLPPEDWAKDSCDVATRLRKLTYGHIAVEELCEVISALDDESRRKELVQLAAVVVQWIECIDRNKSNV